jgi:hypothetical protein
MLTNCTDFGRSLTKRRSCEFGQGLNLVFVSSLVRICAQIMPAEIGRNMQQVIDLFGVPVGLTRVIAASRHYQPVTLTI